MIDQQVTTNFNLKEFTYSDTALRLGMVTPEIPADVLNNLCKITIPKCQQARDIIGLPFHINSGWRWLELEAIITHSHNTTGAHPKGLASDVICPGMDRVDVFSALISDKIFMEDVDQLILEAGCIHIGMRNDGKRPRKELRKDQWIDGSRHYPLIAIWPTTLGWRTRL